MRIAVAERRGQADVRSAPAPCACAIVEAVDAQRLRSVVRIDLARMQRAVGVLEHHLHVAAERLAAHGARTRLAVDRDRAGPRASSAGDAPQDRRLAGARFADQAEALARGDGEADVVEDPRACVAERRGDASAVDRDVAHGQLRMRSSSSGRAAAPAAARAAAADPRHARRAGRACRGAARCRDPPPRSSSTMRPAYMISTRSQKSRTRLRSWLMKIRPSPRSLTRSSRMRQHLHAHRDVERRGRLVGDEHLGLRDQHHRDHDALAHAARDLVRIEARRRAPDRGCAPRRACRAPAALRLRPRLAFVMHAVGLGDLVADALHRVERDISGPAGSSRCAAADADASAARCAASRSMPAEVDAGRR